MPFPPPPKRALLSTSIPVGSVLLYEDFSRYREGDATPWGPNTLIKTGLDRRNWLVSNVEGAHPVGCRIRLPDEFYFECRYSAYMPEVTRGVLGWWKEPVGTRISLLDQQGGKYTIQWVMKCGNDLLRPNPLGSSTLYAKKCFHTVKLSDGTTNEIEAIQPTGMLRIERIRTPLRCSLTVRPSSPARSARRANSSDSRSTWSRPATARCSSRISRSAAKPCPGDHGRHLS